MRYVTGVLENCGKTNLHTHPEQNIVLKQNKMKHTVDKKHGRGGKKTQQLSSKLKKT